MGLLAKCRFSSIINASISYLSLKKKKKKKKKKKSATNLKDPLSKNRNLADSSKEDVDFEKQFGEERFVDDKECLWLSSDCSSPSAFFEQCRTSLSHYLVDEWIVSWLSTPGSLKLVDSRGEESLASGRDLKGEEELLLLTSSEQDPSVTLHESSLVPVHQQSSEDTTSCNHSSSTAQSRSDLEQPRAQDHNEEGVNFMISLVSLDGEGCKRIPGGKLDQEGAPRISKFSVSNSFILEDAIYRKSHDAEPLFWPFEWKFDLNPEEKVGYFCMSPRRGTFTRVESKRWLDFSSVSKSFKRMELSQGGKSLCKTLTMRSRLSTNSRNGAQVVSLSVEGCIPLEMLSALERDFFGEEGLSFNDEIPIEKLLGLEEFDGHEGLEAGANRDTFLLDKSFLDF